MTATPDDVSLPPREPSVTDAVEGPLQSNDWWSSALWEDFSRALFAHPFVVRATDAGLAVGRATSWEIHDTYEVDDGVQLPNVAAFDDGGEHDFVVSHGGVDAFDDAPVDGWSDWSVLLAWRAAGRERLRSTITMGCPFLFFDGDGDLELRFETEPELWSGDAASDAATDTGLDAAAHCAFSVDGTPYAAFGPAGSSWELEAVPGDADAGFRLVGNSGDESFLSVATLPDASEESLETFAQRAYNVVEGTRLEWEYDEAAATVETTYRVETAPREESDADGTILGLLPHQWKHADVPTEWTMASPCGELRLAAGDSFVATLPFQGVLPFLPAVEEHDAARLGGYVEEAPLSFEARFGDGAYWRGKWLERLRQLQPIADQVDDDERSAAAEGAIRDELQRWFTRLDEEGEERTYHVFYYDDLWGTLLASPETYGAGENLNDHHFHYGYLVNAAAAIARLDGEWPDRWGWMVEELIRDYANPSREDDRYPFLRCFSPYEGHSWSDGSQRFSLGNNQESSSEAVNAAAAMIYWGEYTGSQEIRDAGVFLYAQETAAALEYWFDVDGDSHPEEWPFDTAAKVWGGGYDYNIWDRVDAEEIHGINYLPLGGHSAYLARDVDGARANYEELVANTDAGEEFTHWPDILWEFRALTDPEEAVALFEQRPETYPVEFAESRAHTAHWLYALLDLGSPESTITGNTSLYGVFDDGEATTYAAYNPTDQPLSVTFSDGTELEVAPRRLETTAETR